MQTPAQNESTVAMQLQHLLRNLDQFKLAPENNIYHNDFEQSLTRSPTWLSAEEIAARLASPTESSSTESKLLPPPDRWVLLLSKVTLSCESGDIMTTTENEFLRLPLALVLPPGHGQPLFLYRHWLRLRIDTGDYHAFSWSFDADDPSILVLKISGTQISGERLAADGETIGRPQDPGQLEQWSFWPRDTWKEWDELTSSIEKHYITIRAHCKGGARAVGEFGRLLDETRLRPKENEHTSGYEGIQRPQSFERSQTAVHIQTRPTAHARKRPGPRRESFPKRYHHDSLARHRRSRSRSPPRMDMPALDSSSYRRPRSPNNFRHRADTWRPGYRYTHRRSSALTRSPEPIGPLLNIYRPDRSPDKRAQIELQTLLTDAGDKPHRDKDNVERWRKLPENRESSQSSTERSKEHKEKEKWIREVLAKPTRG
jgi:hypothetical protein